MFTEQLQQLGLTEGEAKVYEALVALGTSTVGPIVKKSGVAYSNVYEILQRLMEKGLVSFVTKEKTKHFSALPPNRLQEFIEKQEEKIQESKSVLHKILPSLTHLQTFDQQRLDAEIFIGQKGLLTAYDLLVDDVTSKDVGRFLYVHDPSYLEQASEFFAKFWKRMRQRNMRWKGIVNKEYMKTKLADQGQKLLEQRWVDFPIPATVDIVKDKVLITTWGGKPVGILIHSKEVADNFRNYFEAVWKIAKK